MKVVISDVIEVKVEPLLVQFELLEDRTVTPVPREETLPHVPTNGHVIIVLEETLLKNQKVNEK
jgi:hypothetical protein